MRFTKSTLVVLSLALATTAFQRTGLWQKSRHPYRQERVATITEMENASVKADMDGDCPLSRRTTLTL